MLNNPFRPKPTLQPHKQALSRAILWVRPSLRATALVVAMLTLMLTPIACSKSEPTPPVKDDKAPHTLMFYFMGTDLFYDFESNIFNISEAIREGQAKDNRVIYFQQQRASTQGKVVELILNEGKCEKRELHNYTIPNVVDPQFFTSVISKMSELAPAHNYSIVLGGHGKGWIPIEAEAVSTADIDDPAMLLQIKHFNESVLNHIPSPHPTRHFGDPVKSMDKRSCLDIDELTKALADTGIRFDYILFDACLMSNIETLYEMRNRARYFVASPTEIMSAGFPYADMLEHLFTLGGSHQAVVNKLDQVSQAFNKYYNDRNSMSGSIAVIDASKLESLAEVCKRINHAEMADYSPSNLQTYEAMYSHVFFDLGDYVNSSCSDAALKAEFKQKLAQCIVSKYTLDAFWSNLGSGGRCTINRDKFSGVSTSAPSTLYRTAYEESAWYRATH